jgi:hypothetical protein
MYKATTTFDIKQQLYKARKAQPRGKRSRCTDTHSLPKPCIKGYRQCTYNNGNGACLLGADQCTKKEIKNG